jgi:Calx-beta domain
MRLFQNLSSRLNRVQLLGIICLLFLTAQVGRAQSDPTISVNDISVAERDSGLYGYEFTISLSAASTKKVSVTASTQPGTATTDVDFGGGLVTVDLPAGQTSITVTVYIKGDTIVEPNETFFLNLTNPVNATIAKGQGVGTIIDDDTLFLLNENNSSRGLALDSVFHTRESFKINTGDLPFYSSDHRMRIVVFAVGLKLAVSQTVMATAEDSVGTIRPLTVEAVNEVPNMNNWLTQVTLKLNDQIPAGDMKVKIIWNGVTSNAVNVAVTAQ